MRRSRIVTLLATVGLVGTLLAVPVSADPSSDEVRGQLQTAEERLQDLQMQAAAAVEDYNEAAVALEELRAELEATEGERDRLASEVDALVEAAGDHARRLHKLGPTIELSSVFVAGDGAEIGARTAALGRILDGQRADLEGLQAARTSLDAAEERLEAQYAQAREREAEVAAAREQVEATIASQQDEIDELEVELDAAQEREAEAERRRQEAEERARRQAEQETAERAAAEREAAQQTAAEQAAEEEPQQASEPTTTSNDSSTSSGGSDDGSSESAPSTRQSAQVAVDTALDQVGKPYRYGAAGPDAYDCSGLTSYSWRAAGVDITRTSRSQWHATSRVSRSQLQPGDLVFFSRDGTPGGIGHVAMYIGGGDVVEASRSGVPVRTSSSALSRSDILGYGRP